MKIPRWLWWKKYFDQGMGITGYAKYLIAFFGISSLNWKLTMVLGIAYGISCFFVGWIWIKKKLADKENEINNLINPFQKELRRSIRFNGKRKIYK